MNNALYALAGLAVVYEIVRLARGGTFNWTKALTALVVAALLAAGIAYLFPAGKRVAVTPQDATYGVEGERVTLAGAYSYFGNEKNGDLNGDGVADTAFLLVHQPGGSGSFYYVVVAVADGGGYTGTNAVLLGDRIAPQTTEIRDGLLIVNYADRREGEPYTERPSVGVSKYLRVIDGVLTEVPAPR